MRHPNMNLPACTQKLFTAYLYNLQTAHLFVSIVFHDQNFRIVNFGITQLGDIAIWIGSLLALLFHVKGANRRWALKGL